MRPSARRAIRLEASRGSFVAAVNRGIVDRLARAIVRPDYGKCHWANVRLDRRATATSLPSTPRNPANDASVEFDRGTGHCGAQFSLAQSDAAPAVPEQKHAKRAKRSKRGR